MTDPLVSVIISTYNWSSVLRCAIQSVLAQTFSDFEMLVIGDGCTDDSAAVVASFGDSRIRWHNLATNSGNQSIPNNKGLELARGKYVAYLGHDDIWHPTHLALLVKALQENDADLAHTIGVMIGPPKTGIRMVTGVTPAGAYSPVVFIPPSSVMHTREVVAKTGPWREYRTIRLPPDREFVGRIWLHRQRFASVPELTVFKFNSAWRRNSYIEKPSHEQAEYLRRIRVEGDFIAREWEAIKHAEATGKTKAPIKVKMPRNPQDVPPGWLVEQWRRTRGLEPKELPEVPGKGDAGSLLAKTLRGIRGFFKL